MEEVIPTHVGIIMDGNGRWATKRGLARNMGHKAGAATLKKLIQYIYKKNIKYLSVYAFSSENFKRSKEEVDGLMNLFLEYFSSLKSTFLKEEICVMFSGRKDKLPHRLVQQMEELEEETKHFTKAYFNILLNYGSRNEVVDMTKKIAEKVARKELSLDEIDDEVIRREMYHNLPDLDFIIRTGGELRLSNFMLWQASYAEFYFTDVYFPDFDEKEFDKALESFQQRKRKYGGVL